MKKTKQTKTTAPEFPCTVETYRHPSAYWRDRFVEAQPSCFNGIVSIRRYRITFEEIEEPREVLIARLNQLWEQSDNHHDCTPLLAVARSLGAELDYKTFGTKRPKRP